MLHLVTCHGGDVTDSDRDGSLVRGGVGTKTRKQWAPTVGKFRIIVLDPAWNTAG
jgi:hypothetical protein